MDSLAQENVPFRGVLLNSETPEEKEKRAAELLSEASAIRLKQSAIEQARHEKEQQDDMQKLMDLRTQLRELEGVQAISGKLSIEDALQLSRKLTSTKNEIDAIEDKYGYAHENGEPEPQKKLRALTSIWPTVSKIVALLIACWGIVIYSGDWILGKYPNAAIYNEVSFQKVLFAFSVFIAGIAIVFVALNVFIHGIGKYFNPFNGDQLDFFNDFKLLNEWQRVLISVVLFCAFLFSFVLIVSGKLD